MHTTGRPRKASVATLQLIAIVLVMALKARQLQADEGRVPVFGVTTITQKGHYILTRDIPDPAAPGSNVITITADDVTLDLNGHTISPAAGFDAIVINTTAGPREGITIRNGKIVGGARGIDSPIANTARVRFQDLEVSGSSGSGIVVGNARYVEVSGCQIHDVKPFGILVDGNGASFEGRFLDNTIHSILSFPMYLAGLRGGEIRRNVIRDYGAGGGGIDGIVLFAAAGVQAGGNVLEGNLVSALPTGVDDDGIDIDSTSPNNLVVNNVVTQNGSFGIRAVGNGTRLERNVVSRNGSHGIIIGAGATGSFIQAEQNQAQENTAAGSCGIFVSNGNGHSIRNNNVRGNALVGIFVAGCMPVAGTNSDNGGNIL
jgi:parallel beta-helix repeat protein